MNNEIIKGFKFSLGIILGLSLFFGIVFAVGFHTADEITSGTFTGNYDFSGATITGIDSINTTYSYTETNTGKKWVDGKPIYRKVINYTSAGMTGSTFYVIDATLTNSYVSQIISATASTKLYSSTREITIRSIFYEPKADGLNINTYEGWGDATWQFVIEYTKE